MEKDTGFGVWVIVGMVLSGIVLFWIVVCILFSPLSSSKYRVEVKVKTGTNTYLSRLVGEYQMVGFKSVLPNGSVFTDKEVDLAGGSWSGSVSIGPYLFHAKFNLPAMNMDETWQIESITASEIKIKTVKGTSILQYVVHKNQLILWGEAKGMKMVFYYRRLS